jgi:hypothetical protein
MERRGGRKKYRSYVRGNARDQVYLDERSDDGRESNANRCCFATVWHVRRCRRIDGGEPPGTGQSDSSERGARIGYTVAARPPVTKTPARPWGSRRAVNAALGVALNIAVRFGTRPPGIRSYCRDAGRFVRGGALALRSRPSGCDSAPKEESRPPAKPVSTTWRTK